MCSQARNKEKDDWVQLCKANMQHTTKTTHAPKSFEIIGKAQRLGVISTTPLQFYAFAMLNDCHLLLMSRSGSLLPG